MQLPRNPADAAILSTLLFPLLSAAAGLDCTHVRVDKTSFDFSELEGARSVVHPYEQDGKNYTTTFTIDICKPLGKVKDVDKSIPQCDIGTRVCAVKRLIRENGEEDVAGFYSIAGELKQAGGKDMNAHFERLKTSTSHADSEKEGVRIEMSGGFHLLESGARRDQKAIVEFVCDKTRSGLENPSDPKDKSEGESIKREDDNKNEDDSTSASLTFVRYDQGEGEADILRMQWRTNHACEGSKEKQDAEKGSHWGLFTWFILIAFLSTATYLIFGSWLNYNRYGARGWDLLPHGDTIRDVPYLFKDWMRRVLNTIQGPGSRGGYAAV